MIDQLYSKPPFPSFSPTPSFPGLVHNKPSVSISNTSETGDWYNNMNDMIVYGLVCKFKVYVAHHASSAMRIYITKFTTKFAIFSLINKMSGNAMNKRTHMIVRLPYLKRFLGHYRMQHLTTRALLRWQSLFVIRQMAGWSLCR